MITLVCGDLKMVVSEERAAAIFRIQRKMRVNDWKIDDSNRGTNKKADRGEASPKRVRQGKVSSEQT